MTKGNQTSLLHEILAVEGERDALSKKVIEEASHTFTHKSNLFLGYRKELTMFDENREEENLVDAQKVESTIKDKLNYIAPVLSKHWNTVLSKDLANQEASADLVIEGKVIARDLPATFLLGLETKLKTLRKVYEKIPTREPGNEWVVDAEVGKDVYVAKNKNTRMRTEKQLRSKELAKATNHHPAQIHTWNEDVPIGKWVDTKWSGMISSAEKSELLDRLEKLLQATKQARQRANLQLVDNRKVGEALFSYLHK